MASSPIDSGDSFWSMFSKLGLMGVSGLAQSGAGILENLIAGEETILEQMLPKEAQPFAHMFRPLIGQMASSAYDSLLGDAKVAGFDASDFAGSRSASVVHAQLRNRQMYKALRDSVSQQVFKAQREAIAKQLFSAWQPAGTKFDKNNPDAKTFLGFADALFVPVEESLKSVANSYHRSVGRFQYESNTDAAFAQHSDMLKGLMDGLVISTVGDPKTGRAFGTNSADDVATAASEVIRLNAQRLRTQNLSTKESREQIQKELQSQIGIRLNAYDRLRSVFGKRASAAEIEKNIRELKLLQANSGLVERGQLATRMEQLAINMNMDKDDLKSFRAFSSAATTAAGLDDDLYGGAIALEAAALVGDGTTVRGLSKEVYASNIARELARDAREGKHTDRAAALDIADTIAKRKGLTEQAHRELRDSAMRVSTRQEAEEFARKHGLSDTDIRSIYYDVQDSENMQAALSQSAKNRTQRAIEAMSSALRRKVGKDRAGKLDAAKIQELASMTTSERREALNALGITSYEWGGAAAEAMNNAGFSDTKTLIQTLATASDNQRISEKKIDELSKKHGLSRNNMEAVLQVINEKGDKVGAADIIAAFVTSTVLDEGDARTKANEKLKKDKKVQEAAEKLAKGKMSASDFLKVSNEALGKSQPEPTQTQTQTTTQTAQTSAGADATGAIAQFAAELTVMRDAAVAFRLALNADRDAIDEHTGAVNRNKGSV